METHLEHVSLRIRVPADLDLPILPTSSDFGGVQISFKCEEGMTLNGLLLLTTSTVNIASRSRINLAGVKRALEVVDKRSTVANVIPSSVLYVVQWCPGESTKVSSSAVGLISSLLYSQGNTQIPTVDIRLLLKKEKGQLWGKPLVPIDLVVVDDCPTQVSLDAVKSFVNEWFRVSETDYPVEYLSKAEDSVIPSSDKDDDGVATTIAPDPKKVDVVALGGTFDRMHNAHKILLTEAVLRCNKEIIVGVTSDNMIKNKLLYEFIEPCPVRKERVKNFLADVAPHLSHRVVTIDDPFGPTIAERDIDLLVVSAETIKGGEKINEIRKERGLPPLDIHHIKLFNDEVKQNDIEEDKISSSSQRIRILGDRLLPPRRPPSIPYIIGLTGAIASGKSTLCAYFETLGLPTINCDLLGHEAYKKGTKCFDQIVQTFGEDVLNDSKDEVNRKVLGTKVFDSPSELKKLTSIVWPEIKRLAQEKIDKFASEGHRAVVLDAAVLIEAGWDDMCHDICVVIIPKEETIKRVQIRDNLSEEDSTKRVSAQVSNHERLKKANFVFCSLWEVDFTRRQADKAWQDIKSVIDSL